MSFPHFDPKSKPDVVSSSISHSASKPAKQNPISRFVAKLFGQTPPATPSVTSFRGEVISDDEALTLAKKTPLTRDELPSDIPRFDLEDFVHDRLLPSGDKDEMGTPTTASSSPISASIDPRTPSSPKPSSPSTHKTLVRSASAPGLGIKVSELRAPDPYSPSSSTRDTTHQVADDLIRRYHSDPTEYREPRSGFSFTRLFHRIFRSSSTASTVSEPATSRPWTQRFKISWRFKFTTPNWLLRLLGRGTNTSREGFEAFSTPTRLGTLSTSSTASTGSVDPFEFEAAFRGNCEDCKMTTPSGSIQSLSENPTFLQSIQSHFSTSHLAGLLFDQFAPKATKVASMMQQVAETSRGLGLSTDYSFMERIIPKSLLGLEWDQPLSAISAYHVKKLLDNTSLDPSLRQDLLKHQYFSKRVLEGMVTLKLQNAGLDSYEQARFLAVLFDQKDAEDFTVSAELDSYLDHVLDAEVILNPLDIQESDKEIHRLTEEVLDHLSFISEEDYRDLYHAFEGHEDPVKGLQALLKCNLEKIQSSSSKAPRNEDGIPELGPEDMRREFLLLLRQMAKDGRFDLIAKIATLDPRLIAEADDISFDEKRDLANTHLNITETLWRLLGGRDPNTTPSFDLISHILDQENLTE